MKVSISGLIIIVMVFSILVLTIFSTLSILLVNRDSSLTDMMIANTVNYYTADSKATRVLSYIKEGKSFSEVSQDLGVIITQHNNQVEYEVPISENQSLIVQLYIDESNTIQIKNWSTQYIKEWEPNDSIKVWDGNLQ